MVAAKAEKDPNGGASAADRLQGDFASIFAPRPPKEALPRLPTFSARRAQGACARLKHHAHDESSPRTFDAKRTSSGSPCSASAQAVEKHGERPLWTGAMTRGFEPRVGGGRGADDWDLDATHRSRKSFTSSGSPWHSKHRSSGLAVSSKQGKRTSPAALICARGTRLSSPERTGGLQLSSFPHCPADTTLKPEEIVPQNHLQPLLPVLLPGRRKGSGAMADSLPANLTQRKYMDAVYTQLGASARHARRLATPESLKPSGDSPFIVGSWEPHRESPEPPHHVGARLASSSAKDSTMLPPSDPFMQELDTELEEEMRRCLAHGDWATAVGHEQLVQHWPESWRRAALRRVGGRTVGVLRLGSEESGHVHRTKAKTEHRLGKPAKPGLLCLEFSAGFQRMYLFTTRLVKCMRLEPHLADLVRRVSQGLAEQVDMYERAAGGHVDIDDVQIHRRWTASISKLVPKSAKPAEVVAAGGEALMDRVALHSVFADLGGCAEGGVEARARLAQAGTCLDRIFDSMIECQRSQCALFGLSKTDAGRGLCYDAFLALLGNMFPSGPLVLPQQVARQLFDEFAGSPGIELDPVEFGGLGGRSGTKTSPIMRRSPFPRQISACSDWRQVSACSDLRQLSAYNE